MVNVLMKSNRQWKPFDVHECFEKITLHRQAGLLSRQELIKALTAFTGFPGLRCLACKASFTQSGDRSARWASVAKLIFKEPLQKHSD